MVYIIILSLNIYSASACDMEEGYIAEAPWTTSKCFEDIFCKRP